MPTESSCAADVDGFGRVLDLIDDRARGGDRGIGIVLQVPEDPLMLRVDALGQVAVGHRLEHARYILKSKRDQAR